MRDDGSLLISDVSEGTIIRAEGPDFSLRTAIVEGLEVPSQMALAGDSLCVTEASAVVAIDLKTMEKRLLAGGLALPDGLAVTPWGTLIVAESLEHRLLELVPSSGAQRVIAEDLPIGFEPGFLGVPPAFLPTGLAVTCDGTIYVVADQDQSLLALVPR